MAKGQARITIAERRQRVARLYARKLTQREIARTLGISQPTVCRDLQAIEQQWLEDSAATIDSLKSRELAELQDMERDLSTIASTDPDPSVRIRAISERRHIKARIAAMMGIDAPKRTELSGAIETREMSVAEALSMLGIEDDGDDLLDD